MAKDVRYNGESWGNGGISLRREKKGNTDGLFPGFHKIYLPFGLWFIGYLLTSIFLIGEIFWVQVFAVEGHEAL